MSHPHTKRRVPTLVVWLGLSALLLGGVFAWWAISPLFFSTRVDEAFPVVDASAIPDPTAAPEVVAVPFATATPDGASPLALTAIPEEPTPGAAEEPTPEVEPTVALEPTPEVEPTGPVEPTEPIALASGTFTFIDRLHWAEGVATIYQLPDGSRILRLENFKAQNGPDLRIGIAGHPMPRSSAELHDTGPGYIEFERLTANEGNQNYAIPADLELDGFMSVVIYCRAFSTVFSTAELT
ncbi:DM13 domain-containing protein [Candidatus Chloroploca sp. Khr17]|uniref:DM13 domain-containing protein n=1 Tax=Candidatus Chloroploca sp. Khr17 TaxID=2496869 RepID=UPI0013EC5FC6|nr:DM13 domain-containing protein [Candidatus Chloroploca sp. Khr17]